MAKESAVHLHIVNTDGTVFEGDVDSVNLNTSSGYITVLPNHSALISTLAPGTIEVRTKDGVEKFEEDQGVVDISPEKTVILLRTDIKDEK